MAVKKKKTPSKPGKLPFDISSLVVALAGLAAIAFSVVYFTSKSLSNILYNRLVAMKLPLENITIMDVTVKLPPFAVLVFCIGFAGAFALAWVYKSTLSKGIKADWPAVAVYGAVSLLFMKSYFGFLSAAAGASSLAGIFKGLFLWVIIFFIAACVFAWARHRKNGFAFVFEKLKPAAAWCAGAALYFLLAALFMADKGATVQIVLALGLLNIGVFTAIRMDRASGVERVVYGSPSKKEMQYLWIFSGVMLLMYSFDLLSWKYSFIGDEYAFWDFQWLLLSGQNPLSLFSEAGVYGFNPVVTSVYQLAMTLLFGGTLFGWKLSAVLPVIASIIPFYIWCRLVFRRTVAFLALIIFSFSLTLLGISHIGYNNSQAMLPFILSLLFFELALRKNSSFFALLTAFVMAAGWYNYYVTRPLIVIIALYWFLSPLRKNLSAKNAVIGVGSFLAMIFFLLISPDFYKHMAQKSILGGGEQFVLGRELPYILANFVHAFFAFIYKYAHGHFISGPLLDTLSAGGLLVGLAWSVLAFMKDWRAKFILSTYLLMVFFTGALVQYAYPVNTRMFILVPVMAVLSAAGLARGAAMLGMIFRSSKLYSGLIWGIAIIVAILNIYGFYYVMPKNFHFTEQSYLVKYAKAQKNREMVMGLGPSFMNLDISCSRLAQVYGYGKRFAIHPLGVIATKLNDNSLQGKLLIMPAGDVLAFRDMNRLAAAAINGYTNQPHYYVFDFAMPGRLEEFKAAWSQGPAIVPEAVPEPVVADPAQTQRPVVQQQEEQNFSGSGAKATGEEITVYAIKYLSAATNTPDANDIAATKDGNALFISDGKLRKIVSLKKDYGDFKVEKSFSIDGSSKPTGVPGEEFLFITLDESKKLIYVLDTAKRKISSFDYNGKKVSDIITDEGLLATARSLRLSPDGAELYVSNPAANRVAAIAAQGGRLAIDYTKAGKGPGEVAQPCFFMKDSAGNYHVVDAENRRVQIFGAGMKFIKEVKYPDRLYTQYGPQIAEGKGFMVMMNAGDANVLFYTVNGNKTKRILLQRKIELKLRRCSGVAVDGANNLYLLETGQGAPRNILKIDALPVF